MASEFGNALKLSLFGESHGTAVGAVLDGLPAGEFIDRETLAAFLARRSGGKRYSTPRKEADVPAFLYGVKNGQTTGSPLCLTMENANVRSADYHALADTPRPSHADYPARVKYRGFEDSAGGGHFSGRLTAPLCAAGGICLQILARRNILIGAHIASIGTVSDERFDPAAVTGDVLTKPSSLVFPTLDETAGQRMQDEIEAAAAEADSVGGVVECGAIGLPTGVGSPLFDGIENRLSAMIFGIGAVRGIEFGTGFAASAMRGSEHNDAYCIEDGTVRTKTNHHGGVLGGITTGMPLVFRVAFKPTPSIGRLQHTVDLNTMTETTITIQGRHDPCIVPRAVPCVEAAAAIALLDCLLAEQALPTPKS